MPDNGKTPPRRRPSTRASRGHMQTWGPYWDVMFPPAMVTEFEDWKRCGTGVNFARKLWAERERLRAEYEAVHGADPDNWPTPHPTVELPDGAFGCLRCHWFTDSGRLRGTRRAEQHEQEHRRTGERSDD